MQPNMLRRWLPSVTGLTLLACAIGAHAATGARVVLQVWNPQTPDHPNVVTLVDQPSLVSDSLQDAWVQARPLICEQLRLRMGVGGAAAGETLYDITCLLDEQVALDVASAGQNTLRGTFSVGGYIEATSTTPTALGEYADPRFSVALTAKLELTLAVQPNRDQTLRVSKALFTLGGTTLDSHNFSGDVLEFVSDDMIPFFGGPNFKSIAENAVNAVSFDLASRFDAALAPVNAQLKGPSDAVRVGVSGSAGYISLAFASREIAPPANGSMTGLLRWDPAQFTPRNGCQSFDIRATVQTGPVPMFTANAQAPTRQVGVFRATPASAHTCAFTMTGLAAGWPNVLTARVVDGSAVKSAGSSIYGVSYALSGDGWDGRNVVPQPVADARNYVVSRSLDATYIEAPGRAFLKNPVGYRTNPRINPADIYTRQAESANVSVLPQFETVSLNPQPLPPRPDPAFQTQAIAQQAGTNADIIIVSGKNANPFEREPYPVDANAEALKGAEQQRVLIREQKNLRGVERTLETKVRDDAATNAYSAAQLQSQVRQGPSYRELSQPENTIRVEVRYPTAYGYKNAAGVFDPAPNSCDAFSVKAAPVTAGRPRENRQLEMIQIAKQARMRDSNGVYVCEYLISYLLLDQPINVRVGVGSPREPSTEAWMGGSEAQPAQGQRRAIADDSRTVLLTANQPRASLTFDMTYSGEPWESAIATPVATGARSGAIEEALRGITTQEPPICTNARSARARNSPAAPGLEAQCRAQGGTL